MYDHFMNFALESYLMNFNIQCNFSYVFISATNSDEKYLAL